ncbi:MAG: hypothetical protein KA318_01595 [Nitrosomonas sp.]|nr:hypothetical protein [Nitrosomonas sp.]
MSFSDDFIRVYNKKALMSRQGELLKHLAWPVWMWEVRILDETPKLNLFQSVILRLMASGLTDRSEIAKILSLDEALIAYILANELSPYVNTNGSLSEEGRKILTGEPCPQETARTSFILVDALMGQPLPMLFSSTAFIQPDVFGPHPSFVMDREKNWIAKPYCLKNIQEAPDRFPDLSKWLHSYQDQSKDSLYQIEILNDVPTPAYLWTIIYQSQSDQSRNWFVADPSKKERNGSRWMRELIEQALDRPALAAQLTTPLSGLLGKIDQQNVEGLNQQIRLLNESVRLDLLNKYPWLGKADARISQSFESICQQRNFMQDREKIQSHENQMLAISCAKLLENLLQWMVRRWPDQFTKSMVECWSDQGKSILHSLPVSGLNERVINQLSGVSGTQIHRVLQGKMDSIRPLMTAVVLCSPRYSDHPLRHIDPQWDALFKLAKLRNDSAHASQNLVSTNEAFEQADFILNWTTQFKDYFSHAQE